jgi:hypothetical protein
VTGRFASLVAGDHVQTGETVTRPSPRAGSPSAVGRAISISKPVTANAAGYPVWPTTRPKTLGFGQVGERAIEPGIAAAADLLA